MKVVFVAPNLEVGGAERQWSILIPALVERGVAAEVTTLDGEGRFFEELKANGIPATCIGLGGRLPVLGTLRAATAIAERKPELIVSAGVSAHLVGYLVGRRAAAPHLAAIHRVPEPGLTLRQRTIVRFVAPRVEACTAVTPSQLAFLASLGFPREVVEVIPNGVQAEHVYCQSDDVRAELGIAEDDFLALLVATLRPEKRAERFVDAVVQANAQQPGIRGLVAGGGPGLEALRSHATGSVVKTLGPRNDVPELMKAADVVCLTSDAEALPLSILEAMAFGKPVVATDVGGVRDAVVDGVTGFVVEPGDISSFAAAILKLAHDPGLAARMGAAGRARHAERFTIERMVAMHLALFERLVGFERTPVMVHTGECGRARS